MCVWEGGKLRNLSIVILYFPMDGFPVPDSDTSLVMLGKGTLRHCFLLMSTLQSSKRNVAAMGARVMGEYCVKICGLICSDPSRSCEEKQGVRELWSLRRLQRLCACEEQPGVSKLLPCCSKAPLLLLLRYWLPKVLSCMTFFVQQNKLLHNQGYYACQSFTSSNYLPLHLLP